ncbi:DUF998 domain-containing protein [Demetria terragena]|uniref:DUF998 domain-containing protein n=1 Tax=Demetria terragena TaxID=63959 RepID=UPI000A05D418|nr:DUF998 domain-containing protein [Demetria terragena]
MTRRSVAALMWIVTIAYWPMQLVVARSWSTPYDWTEDVISALGATTCTEYCSPDHALMNATFIWVGILTTVGAILLAQNSFGIARTGYVLIAASGIATSAVGFLPVDVASGPHTIAAQLHFGTHLVGMICLARALSGPRRYFTVGCIAVAIVGAIAFVTPGGWGLGSGLTERIALDTMRVWTIWFAAMLLHDERGALGQRWAQRPERLWSLGDSNS